MHKRELKVFLSYAHFDSEIVRQVAEGLTAAGIGIWYDPLSGRGENWMQDVERELSTAEYLIFFISPHSVESRFVMRDVQIALHRKVSGEGGAAIIPVLLQDAEVPPLLRRYHHVDLRDGNIDRAVQQLVDAVLHWSNRQSA